jgi:isochorismate synthase
MNIATSVTSKDISEAEFFSSLLNYSQTNNYSIACWQLPHDGVRHVILSQKYQHVSKDEWLEELPAGFIFAPFDKDKESLFLKADFCFSFKDDRLKNPESELETNSINWFFDKVKHYSKNHPGPINLNAAKSTFSQPAKSDFIRLVEKSIEQIEKGGFEKVVPSRYKQIKLSAAFDVVAAFKNLCKVYPNALISFVSIPGIGNWLGASPELLVSVEDKTVFKTTALAGTKPYAENQNIKTVAWTQKEIEEQALVERYIISCFKKIRLREYDEQGPKTIVAGNLMHLKSDFTVDMKATNFPQLGTVMLRLLHPTSAVCGMPLEAAHNFLLTHEGYDREFYAGYLGPVNIDNNIVIFVNIRCLQLTGDSAICYAGAGVTIDSVPEDEWNETELKFKTLLNVVT